jgi:hypothetical protein
MSTCSTDLYGAPPMTVRVIVMALAVVVPRAAPAADAPLGANFQVNTYTTGDQAFPSVSSDAGGNFVVVWNSLGQDGSAYGVFARRYGADGQALDSAEFQVNVFTTGSQASPSVASDPSGGMVVVWHTTVQDGSGHGVYARGYDAAGASAGAEFRVNDYTPGDQNDAVVAADAAGHFVVAWTSANQDGSGHGVFGRRCDASGAPLGDEFQVHAHTTGSQRDPAIAADAGGSFVVVWKSADQDGDGYGIFGRRFDASGLPQGSEFSVNQYTTGNQASPAVASDRQGNFVVAWASFGQDGSGDGVFARLFGADGLPVGNEFQVDADTTGFQGLPSVAHDGAGFVIAWTSKLADDSLGGVMARRYAGSGTAQGAPFRVNSFTTDYQMDSAVATDATGRFIVAWMSLGQDGSFWSVFGQRFAPDRIFGDGFDAAPALE